MQLAELRHNLRLIQERKTEYVSSVDIPLQLTKDEARVQKEIGELENRLLAASSSTGEAADEELMSFREVLAEELRKLRIVPLMLPNSPTLANPDIQDVFVPLRLTGKAPTPSRSGAAGQSSQPPPQGKQQAMLEGEAAQIKKYETGRSHTDLVLEELLRNESCVVVLGEAGSGKSTLLIQLAAQILDANDPSRTPIYINLKAFEAFYHRRRAEYAHERNGNKPFRDFLEQTYSQSKGLSSDFFDHLLDDHPVLILFDGFDRTSDSETVARCIDQFLLSHGGKELRQVCIITTRPRQWEMLKGQLTRSPRVASLAELKPDEIQNLFSNVLDGLAADHSQKERQLKILNDMLETHPTVREIARRPIICTLLAVLAYSESDAGLAEADGDSSAAQNAIAEADIYAKIIDLFLSYRKNVEDRTTSPTPDRFDDGIGVRARSPAKAIESRRALLAHLADEMQCSLENRITSRAEDTVKQYIAATKALNYQPDSADHFLTMMCTLGILIESSKQYDFVHDTFREYLTAENWTELADKSPREFEARERHITNDDSWSKVLRFLGQLAQKPALSRDAQARIRDLIQSRAMSYQVERHD
jgi:predicted NACHT family NTPase